MIAVLSITLVWASFSAKIAAIIHATWNKIKVAPLLKGGDLGSTLATLATISSNGSLSGVVRDLDGGKTARRGVFHE